MLLLTHIHGYADTDRTMIEGGDKYLSMSVSKKRQFSLQKVWVFQRIGVTLHYKNDEADIIHYYIMCRTGGYHRLHHRV